MPAYLTITPGTYRSASPAVLAFMSSRNCLWSTVKPGWGDVTQAGRLTDRCVVQPGTCAPRCFPVSPASAPLATKTSRAAAAVLCNSLIIASICGRDGQPAMQIWGGGCYRRAEIAIPRRSLLRGKAQARQIGAHDDVAGEPARLGSLPEIGCGQRTTGHLVSRASLPAGPN